MSKHIGKMTIAELRAEVRRTRRAITKWVKAYKKGGNTRCHELDEEVAALIGMSLYPGRSDGNMLASVFAHNCKYYIERECRRGKLDDDRQK